MKRTVATLGVVGLAMMGATVAANADPPGKVGVCLATGSASNPYLYQTIDLHALGRVGAGDIVPANSGDIMPDGQNLTPANALLLGNLCVAPPVIVPPDVPPVVVPPVVPPVVVPPVVPPAVVPPDVPPVVVPTEVDTGVTEDVVPPAVVPSGVVPPAVVPSAVVPPAVVPPAVVPPAAAIPAATNAGYNVQTAVGDRTGTAIPVWLAGLTALFTAVGALVLVRGGLPSRRANG